MAAAAHSNAQLSVREDRVRPNDAGERPTQNAVLSVKSNHVSFTRARAADLAEAFPRHHHAVLQISHVAHAVAVGADEIPEHARPAGVLDLNAVAFIPRNDVAGGG